jgi:hypothetical protein
MQFIKEGLKKTLYNEPYLKKLQNSFEQYKKKVQQALCSVEDLKLSKLLQHKKMFSPVWLVCSDLLLIVR